MYRVHIDAYSDYDERETFQSFANARNAWHAMYQDVRRLQRQHMQVAATMYDDVTMRTHADIQTMYDGRMVVNAGRPNMQYVI